MGSVKTGHAGSGVPDSPTVCKSPHDINNDSDNLCKEKDKVKQFLTFFDHAPTIQRIVDHIKSWVGAGQNNGRACICIR